MRGNIRYQVYTLFEQVKAFGQSKYMAKCEFAKEIKNKGLIYNSQNLTERTGVYSHKTADNYRAEMRQCFQYVKDNFGIKDIEKITGDHIKAYLSDKIERTGGNKNTIAASASAVVKMAVALDKLHGNDVSSPDRHVADYRRGIAEAQEGRVLERPEQKRAYQEPQALCDCLKHDIHRVAAQLVAETGVRVSGALSIRPGKAESGEYKYFLDERFFSFRSKGGQYNERIISQELADKIQTYIDKNEMFEVNYRKYLNDIKQAAFASGQAYDSKGTHGLRWNFAQMLHSELIEMEHSEKEADLIVSNEMSHHRAYITRHYLRR
jgi:hypothetical protein